MKYLFVGDIHNHDYMFKDIYNLDKKYNFDRIILFGDYVDDWNTDNHNSLETLDIAISLKQDLGYKVTLLLGNHELSYLGYPCSGHKYELEDIVRMKLEENIDLFDFYTIVKCKDRNYICTHAGLTNGYINNFLGGQDNWKYILDSFSKAKLKNLLPFTVCSYLRGGKDEYSSCMWCDIREHKYFYLQEQIIPFQIIGHTPVEYIDRIVAQTKDKYNEIICIDTHSTYRNGAPYGDQSYLIWNEDKFEIINKDEI